MTHHDRSASIPQRSPYFGAAWLLIAACSAPAKTTLARTPVLPPARAEATELDHPLTLSDVVALALERSPDREAAAARVEAAAATLARAEASLWPMVGVQASYVRSDAPSSYLFEHIDGHALPAGASFNDPGWFGATKLGVGARWNLWNGWRDELATEAAGRDVEARAAEHRALDNELAAAALGAVVDARAARELGAAAEASIATVEAQLAETQARVDRGAALRSDVLSLEVRLAEARENVLRSRLGERLAAAALRRLLSFAPDAALELAGEVTAPTREPATLDEALVEAYSRRPELVAARGAFAAARARSVAADRAWLPRLDLEARGWSVDVDSGVDFDDPNYQLGLALSFDVFDGGARAADRRQARAFARALASADASAVRAIEFDVQQAWLQLDEARARLEVTRTALAASEETLDLVAKQFQAGSVVVTRFLEAESARTQAKSAVVRATLDVERAKLELARARGALIDELLGR
ncbi:MAG: TolC family protein [Planctomycetes bacterium]|nr:TolC family protein [Planctomycetota bacterium]